MPSRVRLTLLLVVVGVTVVACDSEPRTVEQEVPRMVYIALSDSATGNPIPRSSLRYTVAGDSAMSDSAPRMKAAGDSATGNPTPRTLLVTCSDDSGNPVPCRWSTTY